MCPDKKRPAENTCRIVKGLDAVWAHFCPSKPCLLLSIDAVEKNITLRLTARLFAEEKCYGPGVEQLLKAVEKHRSLRAAAASMSMAYSKAWSIVRAAEQGFGCKLLRSTIGGSGGGGAQLTDEARQIMEAYETYCARLNEYGQALFGELFPFCARENHIDSTRK